MITTVVQNQQYLIHLCTAQSKTASQMNLLHYPPTDKVNRIGVVHRPQLDRVYERDD